jgi:hypothetical protein
MNIGFYLLDVNQSDPLHSNIINGINQLCDMRPYDNIALFNNNFNMIDLNQKYYTLSINHAKYFNGLLFLFDTENALLTRTFPCPKKQILYMTKPDWSANYGMPFTLWNNIYMDNRFEFIAGSQEIADLLDICWKKPLETVNNFNYEEINNVIQKLS